MQWLNPSGAWALLGAIPIIALYILRKKAKPAAVPSLLLWRRTQTSTRAARPFQRLKSRLLLWLRLLLVALMAVTLMRPAAIGASAGERVFIFDLSASMQAAVGSSSRIAVAKERAVKILSSMGEGDKLTVLCAGSYIRQPVARSGDHAAARAVIDGIEAQNGGADIDGALSLALAMRRDIPSLSITVFSDAYQSADASVAVESVGVSADNASIADLRLSGDYAYARVENFGAARDATLECYADGALCDMRSVSLDEDGTGTVRFELPQGAGEVRARIVEGDALALDNERFAVARDKAGETALLVSDGNVFLERALSLRDGMKLYKTDDADMRGEYDLYIYDCVLPEELPDTGAVLAIAPQLEVLGITPGDEVKADAGLRRLTGEAADTVCENLSLNELALRAFRPLTGGAAALECGGLAALSLADSQSRRGAVMGFDLHDSNLPLRADFPVLIQNLLGYLLPDVQADVSNADCGDALTLPVNARAISAYALTPSGARAALTGGTLADTDAQGVYTLVETFEDGAERQARFTAHMPRGEADTRRASASSGGADGAGSARSAVEWTKWALLVWLAVLMLEWGVSRRGVSR